MGRGSCEGEEVSEMSEKLLTIRFPVEDVMVDLEQVLKGLSKEHKMRAISLLLGELNHLSDAEWDSLRGQWESCENRSG